MFPSVRANETVNFSGPANTLITRLRVLVGQFFVVLFLFGSEPPGVAGKKLKAKISLSVKHELHGNALAVIMLDLAFRIDTIWVK